MYPSFNFEQDIILENERALLCPLQQIHWEPLLPIATEKPDLLRFSPSLIHTPELLRQYIAIAIKEREQQIRYAFSIFDKEKNCYAGSTSFGSISGKDARIEIGWTWVGTAFQRTGLNRACKALMLHYAFEVLGWERVEFRTDERNIASRTAIEKIGGVYEGLLRSHILMPDGWRRNTVYYSILKNEWKEAISK